MLLANCIAAQSSIVKEIQTEQSVVEILFAKYNNINNYNTFTPDFDDNLFSKTTKLEIESNFDFHKFFNEHDLCKEIKSDTVSILVTDSSFGSGFKTKTNLVFISVSPCSYKAGNNYYDNAFCLKTKEQFFYIYNDEVKSIKTNYHYYWFSELYTNYFAHYSQIIFHSPTDIVFEYNEGVFKNDIGQLDKNFKNPKHKGVHIYPNPTTSSTINIQFLSNENTTYWISLFGIDGKLVKSLPINAKKDISNYELEIGKQAKGIYILKGVINNSVFTRKLIIE